MVVIKFVVPSNKTDSGIEVWRCTARNMEKDYDVDILMTKLRNYYHNPDAQFLLSWYDGTDECSIVSNSDLMELFEYSQETNPNSNEVRINVKLIHSNDDVDTSNQNSSENNHPEEDLELLGEDVHGKQKLEKESDETADAHQHINSESEHEAPSRHEFLPNVPGVPPPIPPVGTTMPWDSPDKMATQMQNPMIAQYPMGQMYYPPPACGQWAQYPYFVPPFMPPAPIVQEAEAQPTPQPVALTAPEAAAKSTRLSPVPSTSLAQLADLPIPSDEPTTDGKSATDVKPAPGSPNLIHQAATKKNHNKDHSRPSQDKTAGGATGKKVSERDAMDKLIAQLRLMGFQQDEKSIKKLVAKYNGDINKVLDKLGR